MWERAKEDAGDLLRVVEHVKQIVKSRGLSLTLVLQ